MPKHRISRQKAREMVEKFKKRRGEGASKPIPALPDGYIFEAKEVKELLDNPAAQYFIINLGLLETDEKGKRKEAISPILCVADNQYKILSSSGISTSGNNSAPLAKSTPEALNAQDDKDFADEEGGFLDESKPYPPPYLEL